jgi:hypothetical protein
MSALEATLKAHGSHLIVKVTDKNRSVKKTIGFKELIITQIHYALLEINWLK